MATTTNTPPAYTLPDLAGKLGVSLWVVVGVLNRRPDLNALVWRSGGRRMISASNLPMFRAALADRGTTAPVTI